MRHKPKKGSHCRGFDCKKYHHVKGCLEGNYTDSIILHVGNNNLKSKKCTEDIPNGIMDLSLSIRNKKECIFVWSDRPK